MSLFLFGLGSGMAVGGYVVYLYFRKVAAKAEPIIDAVRKQL